MTLYVYGIRNCDTVKKARRWLEQNRIPFEFVDFRQNGISREQLVDWCQQCGWEQLVNRRGMTWRKLPEEQRSDLDQDRAIELMLDNPTLIRRPVVSNHNTVTVGFDESQWQTQLTSPIRSTTDP